MTLNRPNHLPQEVLDQIVASIPCVQELWKGLLERTSVGPMLPETAEYLGLASLCLQDLADLLAVARKALLYAKREWALWDTLEPKPELVVFVHCTRFHFDHCAISLIAASNHLASAMWHLHEKIDKPLGKEYKSAKGIRSEWSKRQDPKPESFDILAQLLEDPSWVAIHGYRDEWVHRGLPVLEGEYRQARREIWQDAGTPPPGPYFMSHNSGDGRVAYMVQRDHPQHRLPDLMEDIVGAIKAMVVAVERFLTLFDETCSQYGVTFTENQKPEWLPPEG